VLAESHVAILTSPELRSVTLDAFVCNYSRENSTHTRGLVDDLVALLQPEDVVRHELRRDLTSAGTEARTLPRRRAAG
jgi:S-adenosylmethionine/arginine decarboxylase-like enzyme